MSPSLNDLLIEDFRQQQSNLQNQYQRMHNRIQLIMGLNTALLPAFGATAAAVGGSNVQAAWLIAFAIAGILLSALRLRGRTSRSPPRRTLSTTDQPNRQGTAGLGYPLEAVRRMGACRPRHRRPETTR